VKCVRAAGPIVTGETRGEEIQMSIPQRNSSLILAVVAVLALPFLISIATAHGDPLEVVELRDLADGETRTFGEGEHAVTATREGDRVVLNFPGKDGKTVTLDRSIDCDLASDDCVVKFGSVGEDGNVFVFEMGDANGDHGRVERRIEIVAEGGPHDGHEIVVGAHPRVQVLRLGEDGDLDDVLQNLEIEIDDIGAHVGNIQMPAMPLMIFSGEGERVLRCPEGDTTMTVGEDEVDGIYTCPKHGLTLEAVDAPIGHGFRWRIETADGEDDQPVEL
jgi:hypothetical protein